MADTILDKVTKVRAKLIRTFSTIQIDTLGTAVDVLRITFGEADILGERSETIETYVLTNVILKHPFGNNIRLFSDITSQASDTNAIDLWELLPIEMRIKWTGTYTTEAVAIKQGDFVVEALRDEHNNKIPLIMQVTRILGGFDNKYMYTRKYELTLFRGELTTAMQTAIDNYINSLT